MLPITPLPLTEYLLGSLSRLFDSREYSNKRSNDLFYSCILTLMKGHTDIHLKCLLLYIIIFRFIFSTCCCYFRRLKVRGFLFRLFITGSLNPNCKILYRFYNKLFKTFLTHVPLYLLKHPPF